MKRVEEKKTSSSWKRTQEVEEHVKEEDVHSINSCNVERTSLGDHCGEEKIILDFTGLCSFGR